ncbi:MAG: beta-galactosidase [Dysgonamonadaceae bacterium]|jgi:hypothetical protein|nr:beta-galactosidase [Dysgonamonadaceae bacterium]
MKRKYLVLAMALGSTFVQAQENTSSYLLDVAGYHQKEILEGRLNLGGTNAQGQSVDFNSYYILRDGKPFIPVMGEFHYFRFPNEDWEQEIMKIKAGGIKVLTSYIMWNYHEEKEGVFDWSGDKNLRKFVELCQKHGLHFIARIGPFCHSEMRNGGFPDWTYGREFQVRTNDSVYLEYVDRFFGEISQQLKGLFFKDGGNIIGIQIENELQHSTSPWGIAVYPGQPKERTVASYDEEISLDGVGVQKVLTPHAGRGVEHLRTLKQMAADKGMTAPWYTITGWGNAAFLDNEAIPVGSAYPYPFWSANPKPSQFYLFKDVQANPDYAPVRYDGNRYPSMTAEMGPGGQSIYTQRPRVPAAGCEALVVRCLGSGMNGIGYYVFHGGITPKNPGGFYMSEEPMGVPKMSYDWYSPIGEYGFPKESYRTLRVVNTFINEFSDMLAPMRVVLPDGYEKIKPSDTETLRYAVREKDGSGFVFMTNFQDHAVRHDQTGLSIILNLENETLRIPAENTFTLPVDVSAIFPFNLDLNGIRLKYATAQLLSKIDEDGTPHYIFFAHEGIKAEYLFEDRRKILPKTVGLNSTFEVKGKNGKKIFITTLTRELALNFTTANINGKRYGLISAQDILPENDKITLLNRQSNEFEIATLPALFGQTKKDGRFAVYKKFVQSKEIPMSHFLYTNDRRFRLKMDELPFEGLNDIVLEIDYTGDTGMIFYEGEMLNDHFCQGEPWLVSLKRYRKMLAGKGLYFYLKSLYPNASFLPDFPQERIPDFAGKSQFFKLESLRLIPEYKMSFNVVKK